MASRSMRLSFAALLAGLLCASGLAQSPPDQSGERPPQHGWRWRPAGSQPDRGGPARRGMGGMLPPGPLGQHLFRMSDEDRGPLQEGEEAELLGFAREHMPRIADLLERARRHSPAKYRERLGQMAPRLRHLQRVFATNPRLGQLIQSHAENIVEIDRLARVLRKSPPGEAEHVQALFTVRELMAENVKIESLALEATADQIDADRAAFVERRVLAIVGVTEAELARFDPAFRETLLAFRNADADATAREQTLAVIRDKVEQRVATELEALRSRAAHIREHAAEEVDRRIELILTHAPRDAGPRRGESSRSPAGDP